MPDHIRGRYYKSAPTGRTATERARPSSPAPRLTVEPTSAGDRHVHLWTWDPEHGEQRGVLLNAEQVERLGIDLQIRASYMRGVRPPTGPEPDSSDPGPDDVPLIEVDADAP